VTTVHLVIFYVPEGLPVSGFNGGRDVPVWNTLALAKDEDGLEESPWVKATFTFADKWLCNDGAVMVFYPYSKFVSREVNAWAKWTNFKEEMKWVVLNGLPLSKPDFSGRQTKYFIAKLYVRMENPKDSIPKSHLKFYEQVELETQGYDLPNDGYLMNFISADILIVKHDSGAPWRGAREKTDNLLLALVDLCICEDDLVLDLSASTCISIFLHLYFY
jgi:hypothetical protein